MRRLVELTAAIALVCIILSCTAVRQQKAEPPRPDDFQFHNLQVLPQNITGEELITTMRKFEQGLGVECEYCHAPLPTGVASPQGRAQHDLDKPLDFPSDAKSEKASARTMLRMVATINHDYISKVEQAHTTVTCWTCHRGNTQPDIAPSLPDEPDGH